VAGAPDDARAAILHIAHLMAQLVYARRLRARPARRRCAAIRRKRTISGPALYRLGWGCGSVAHPAATFNTRSRRSRCTIVRTGFQTKSRLTGDQRHA
jgi:hypothetical protein